MILCISVRVDGAVRVNSKIHLMVEAHQSIALFYKGIITFPKGNSP